MLSELLPGEYFWTIDIIYNAASLRGEKEASWFGTSSWRSWQRDRTFKLGACWHRSARNGDTIRYDLHRTRSVAYSTANVFAMCKDMLDSLCAKEPKNRKDDMKRRIAHLRTSHAHIQSRFNGFLQRHRGKHSDHALQKQKAELFSHSQALSQYSDSDRDLEMAEAATLSRSQKMLQDYIGVGKETLTELMSQRERLQGVQKSLVDIMQSLGFSSGMVRAIEKIDFTDRLIVFGGMFGVCLLLVLIWFFVLRKWCMSLHVLWWWWCRCHVTYCMYM